MADEFALAKGIELIRSELSEYENLPRDKKTDYGDSQVAEFTLALAEFSADSSLALKAAQLFDIELSKIKNSPFSRENEAEIHRRKGDCLLFVGDYSAAYTSYKKSLDLNAVPLTYVFLARSQIYSSDLPAARASLDCVNLTEMGNAEKFDLAVTWVSLAKSSLAQSDISKAKELIKNAKPDRVYFENYRLELYAMLCDLNPKSPDSFIRKN